MWRKIKRRLRITLATLAAIPIVVIFLLRWIDPTHSAFILHHNFGVLVNGKGQYASHPWTDWRQISPHIAVAVIAAEDQRFPDHFGIDFAELGKALESDADCRRGASTITQQTAKNLFLWSGRSYVRKALEAALAVVMELLLPKQRILEIYLNIAQTGDSYFGVGIAAQHFFKKPTAKINRHEAARIAAVLPNPIKFSIANPSAYVLERQKWITQQAKQLGGPAILDSL